MRLDDSAISLFVLTYCPYHMNIWYKVKNYLRILNITISLLPLEIKKDVKKIECIFIFWKFSIIFININWNDFDYYMNSY